MPVWFYPLLVALAAPVLLVSTVWLTWHLPEVARTYAGRWGIVEGRRVRPLASRREVELWVTALLGAMLVMLAAPLLVLVRV